VYLDGIEHAVELGLHFIRPSMSKLFVVDAVPWAYNFTQARKTRYAYKTSKPRREMMNMNQIMYDLTYWFDFIMLVVRNHPLISVASVLVAFLFYQALGVMKLIGTIISFGLAVVTAILLEMLM
jgi:hypothetical protein